MKLGSPFKPGRRVRITQTTHGHLANNPSNFSFQRAIDENPDPFGGGEVFAQGEGIINKAILDSKKAYQSYVEVKYNGIGKPKQYVHVVPYKGIVKGMKILRGQRIGTIHPSVVDPKTGKTIHAAHLHDAFYDSTGKGQAFNPFDFLDRDVKVITSAPQIANDKNWFAKGEFQWKNFTDRYFSQELPKGKYTLIKDSWFKKEPDTQADNYRKATKNAVGQVTSGIKTSRGVDFQFIQFTDVSGWIPNTVLLATAKSITTYNLAPLSTPGVIDPTNTLKDIPEEVPIVVDPLEVARHDIEVLAGENKNLKDEVRTLRSAEEEKSKRVEQQLKDAEQRYKDLEQLKGEEILSLNESIKEKDAIILSLRKKRNLSDISSAYTVKEAVEFVDKKLDSKIKKSLILAKANFSGFVDALLKKMADIMNKN